MDRQDITEGRVVDFGFAAVAVPAGTHVCQIYEDDDTRTDAFIRYLVKGLELRELTAGFSDDLGGAELALHLPVDHDNHSLQLERTSEAYFEGDCFNPDGMLEKLKQFYHLSQSGGYTGGRVIGEMAPRIQDMKGSGRLLEYEARVNLLLRDHPLTVMCQYHAHSFSGSTLMDVLKAHALLVVRGAIVHNPYYIPPETLLGAAFG